MAKHQNHPVKCTICLHEQRHRIELALASGASRQAIGRKFAVSPQAVRRHGKLHVSAERRAALIAGPLKLHELAERAHQTDMALQDYLNILMASLFEQYLRCVEVGDVGGFTSIAARLAEIYRLSAQLNGEITKAASVINNTMNIVMGNPQVQTFLQNLAKQLRPYPKALDAVVDWLKGQEVSIIETAGQAQALPALEHRQ